MTVASRARRSTEVLLARSPLQATAMRRAPQRLRVLAYHGVPSGPRFSAQLDWLLRHATPVSLAEVRAWALGGAELPPRAVLITFDDGERSVLETALPLLRDRRVPAVAFVVAGLVDTDDPFWWSEVEHLLAARPAEAAATVRELKAVPDRERRATVERLRSSAPALRTPQLTSADLRRLRDHGIAVGNHTLTHPCLDRCDDEVLRHEVAAAYERLHEVLGEPPPAFAYPNGNVDQRVRDCVADVGHDLGFAFDHRLAGATQDPLLLSRIRVDADAPLDRFRIRVSGLHPALHAARGRT